MQPIIVSADVLDREFSIKGLKFCSNPVSVSAKGSFTSFVRSSAGPQISDYVTHEKGFAYSTAGIHIGQDDRLTFMGDERTPDNIVGYFVDCRKDSPTLHQQVVLSYAPSLQRHLVIPRGVAHTFDSLAFIVTRDEPVWHASHNNPDWNIDNDLVAVSRATSLVEYPVVDTNHLRLPPEAHRFMSRLSQELLKNPKAYLSRHRVTLNGEEKYVSLEPKGWNADREAVHALFKDIEIGIDGVHFASNRFAMTGPKSWTLVPNTANCIAEPAVVGPESGPPKFGVHTQTDRIFTLLNYQDKTFTVDLVDLRAGSETKGKHARIEVVADPRYNIHVPQGVAYRIRSDVSLLVRLEAQTYGEAPVLGMDDLVEINPDRLDSVTISPEQYSPLDERAVYHAHVAFAGAARVAAE